jgi:hypothetical protein
MKIRTLSLLFIAALSTPAAWAAGGNGAPLPPQFSFDSGGVSISGGSVGEPIAWMGMIRERDHAHMAVRFVRGVDAADLSGNLVLAEPGADQAQAIYTAVIVGNGAASVVAAPAFISAIGSIDITATVSGDSISVAAPYMELIYVRPGVGSWTFGTGDGSDLDGDGEENGSITVALAQLIDGGAGSPPETVEAGDVVMVIDPYRIRVGQLVVAP